MSGYVKTGVKCAAGLNVSCLNSGGYIMYSTCEKGGRCRFHVGGLASGLQCTSACRYLSPVALFGVGTTHCSVHHAADSVGGVRRECV